MSQSQKSTDYPFTVVAQPKKGVCQAYRCKCKLIKSGGRFCRKHYHDLWKFRNPEKYVFCNLRSNARRRGKEFSITYDQFLLFLKTNPNYMSKKGTHVKALQIDRIDNNKGYTLENIRAVTMKENLWKRHNVDFSYVPF